jgi:hypothetical protein
MAMKRWLLSCTTLAGAVSIAPAVSASDGIKLEVGGFLYVVYQAVFDQKKTGSFGAHRNVDAVNHNGEIHFNGSATLDNGVTVGAHIEVEAEDAADQVDKSWVYWSGDFGKVELGSQDGALHKYCLLPPGATPNFSAFTPNVWGSNDPIRSNATCYDTEGNSQKIVYTTPSFGGFQLHASYTPSNNAESYGQAGVNSAGTPSDPDGTAHHSFSIYGTYNYAGNGWGLDWGGGGSWQGRFNQTESANDGPSDRYQTAANLTIGGFSVGSVFEYFDTGGTDNAAWVAGGGASYGEGAWKIGMQASHGTYEGVGLGFVADPGGRRTLNQVILTGLYQVGPGVTLDAEAGYTWYHDSGSAATDSTNRYHALSFALGSAFDF